MENFVQMSLETYDALNFYNEHLRRELKKEKESHSEYFAKASREINYLEEIIEQYKKYILGRNCRMLYVDEYSLEDYLDMKTLNYGIAYKEDLLNLGITKQEMDEFIADKYKKAVKEREETDD